ncbi:MAG: hypothetical protein ACLR9W_09070 [Enterobacter hormaechei]
MQFIPAVEQRPLAENTANSCIRSRFPVEVLPNGQYPVSSGNVYEWRFWVRHDVGKVYVQLFDNALAAWLGETPSLCVMQSSCGFGLV